MEKFDAFISYSQHHDKGISVAIQKGLHRFGQKRYLLKFRGSNIFRDETSSIGVTDLLAKIENGLASSRYLILLANSKYNSSNRHTEINWIEKEVAYWLNLSQDHVNRIIICITEGNIKWDYSISDFDWEKTNCLPNVLRNRFKAVPFWIDMKELSYAGADLTLESSEFRLKIAEIASVLKSKSVDELISEDLAAKRIWTLILSTVSISLIILTSVTFYLNTRLRNETYRANSENHVNKLELAKTLFRLDESNKALAVLQNLANEGFEGDDSFNLMYSSLMLNLMDLQQVLRKYDSLKVYNHLRNKYFLTKEKKLLKIEVDNIKDWQFHSSQNTLLISSEDNRLYVFKVNSADLDLQHEIGFEGYDFQIGSTIPTTTFNQVVSYRLASYAGGNTNTFILYDWSQGKFWLLEEPCGEIRVSKNHDWIGIGGEPDCKDYSFFQLEFDGNDLKRTKIESQVSYTTISTNNLRVQQDSIINSIEEINFPEISKANTTEFKTCPLEGKSGLLEIDDSIKRRALRFSSDHKSNNSFQLLDASLYNDGFFIEENMVVYDSSRILVLHEAGGTLASSFFLLRLNKNWEITRDVMISPLGNSEGIIGLSNDSRFIVIDDLQLYEDDPIFHVFDFKKFSEYFISSSIKEGLEPFIEPNKVYFSPDNKYLLSFAGTELKLFEISEANESLTLRKEISDRDIVQILKSKGYLIDTLITDVELFGKDFLVSTRSRLFLIDSDLETVLFVSGLAHYRIDNRHKTLSIRTGKSTYTVFLPTLNIPIMNIVVDEMDSIKQVIWKGNNLELKFGKKCIHLPVVTPNKQIPNKKSSYKFIDGRFEPLDLSDIE